MEQKYCNGDWRMRQIKRIHFVGIGGVGMSGIAEVLLNEGYNISGTDISENSTIVRLRSLGVHISIGHVATLVEGADVVVQSSAISADNVEIKHARELRIPVVARAQMLAELMRFRRGIAVAGTHGKTTTTSLIASVLAEAKLDPTYVIGGILNGAGSNARLGLGQYFVAEADESDASFLYLQPLISVVTNIDVDHMATYQNDPLKLEQTFIDFLHHLPFYGLCVLCMDDPVVRKSLPKINRQQITYGFEEGADWVVSDFHQKATVCYFTACYKKEDIQFEVQLNLPGRHNVLNALAAIAIAHELGISHPIVVQALKSFGGVKRRFSILGEFPVDGGHATIIDDYGHHPREIDATMTAARGAWPGQRLVLVFQPHRYTRTADLFEDFSLTLSKADELLLLDVYPAGETPIAGADSRDLCRSVRTRGQVNPIFVGEITELRQTLNAILKPNDIVLMQGAGNIGSAALQLMNPI